MWSEFSEPATSRTSVRLGGQFLRALLWIRRQQVALELSEVRQPLLLRSRECRERADILLLSPMLVIALVFIGLATFFSAVFR